MKTQKSFTLIEMAVVIAIIGLVFSLILLGVIKKEEARDARILADMAQIRTKAELIMVVEGSYNLLSCNYGLPNDTEVQKLCNDIDSQDGATPDTGDVPYPKFNTSPTEYCITSELLVDYEKKEDRHCIDNDGRTGRTTSGCSGFDCINIR